MRVKEESKKAGLKLNIHKTKIIASCSITSWQMGKKMETVTDFIFLVFNINAEFDCSHEIERHFLPWKESYKKPRQHTKNQRHRFANKGTYNQSYGFSSSQVQMCELDHKED